MQVEQMPIIRVFFEKRDRAKYISHLDTMRTLTRALKRSGLPLWYTQGFNPHLYLTFALPIALGYESLCESFDIRLTGEIGCGEIVKRLNTAFPPGFRVTEAAPPVMKPSEIAWADYGVRLYFPGEDAEGLAEKWTAFFGQDQIVVTKRTKKGEKELDIRPLSQSLALGHRDGELELELRLAAGNAINVAPTLLLQAFYPVVGREPERAGILRKSMRNAQLAPFR